MDRGAPRDSSGDVLAEGKWLASCARVPALLRWSRFDMSPRRTGCEARPSTRRSLDAVNPRLQAAERRTTGDPTSASNTKPSYFRKPASPSIQRQGDASNKGIQHLVCQLSPANTCDLHARVRVAHRGPRDLNRYPHPMSEPSWQPVSRTGICSRYLNREGSADSPLRFAGPARPGRSFLG